MGFSSSMFWPYQNAPSSTYDNENYDYTYMYPSPASASVDCTLSLGTPSTRLSTNSSDENTKQTSSHHDHNNSVSSFCWDLLHPCSYNNHSTKPAHRSSAAASSADPLVARRCANCDTTSTPLWRNGPRGPKSLCNACGIRFKKEERRAAAAQKQSTAAGGSWGQQYSQGTPQKMQYNNNEFRFMEDGTDDSTDNAGGIQFLSWLTHDRPTALVHDFTR